MCLLFSLISLLQVYLNAIEGYVSPDVIRAFSAFLEFCYIARRNVITESSLEELKVALQQFHKYRVVAHEEVITNISG
jgi:hypothetical protein